MKKYLINLETQIMYKYPTFYFSTEYILKKEENGLRKYKGKKSVSTISSICGSSMSISTISEKNDDADPFKFRVFVLNTKSPDCIYVADPNRERVNSILKEELQQFYNSRQAIFEELPQKDMMCAAYSTKDKAFFRAKILDIKSESEVVVFFIDLGLEETVSISDLQPLEKKFLTIPRYQFKVKLAGITPCGGSSSWPSSSCEKLREIVYLNEGCKFFISKVVSNSSKTLIHVVFS